MAIKPLEEAIREQMEWLEDNSDEEPTETAALEDLMDDCGQDARGHCSLAGTEYCDFECPFSG